ncbi:probable cytochrome P450 313a1 [Anopheles funestus]|uniref:probable cytochrome P450 313a1 n=1 Tax=Anopheles funestus TaxID=62324 RepID=UPI0020C6363B|nr:probable cytochrome P450 313a1 [Anopheles funestus]
MILLVFISVFAIVYYINFRRSRKRLYELAKQIPGPFDYPLIGSLLETIGKDPLELIAHFMELMHHIPSPMRAWLGPYLIVIVAEPAMVQDILRSPDCVQKPDQYHFFRLSKGLFGAPAGLWRKHRKLLNTSFSPAVLKSFVPTLNAKAEEFSRELNDKVSSECFDVHTLLARFTLITISSTTLGADLSVEKREVLEEYSSNAVEMFTSCFERIYKTWLYPEFVYRMTSAFKEEQTRFQLFKQMSRKIINMRQAIQSPCKSQDEQQDSDPEDKQELPRGKNFIERLEEMSHDPANDIDEDGFQQHIDTMMFAGNDTSAQTLSNAMLALGMYPDWQEKVYQEIMDVAPTGPISYEDLSKLTYMEMFLKETLRLLPITGLIARLPTKEVQAQHVTIPPGAIVLIPFLKIHRDKTIWGPDAELFNPDNFLPERCAQRHPYAYIPFSQGPRNCIGMKYAWISMKIFLCHVVRQYRIATDIKLSDIKFSLSLIMKLNTKHLIRLERRSAPSSDEVICNSNSK